MGGIVSRRRDAAVDPEDAADSSGKMGQTASDKKTKKLSKSKGGVLFGSCFGGGGGDDDTDDDDEEKQHEDEGSSRDKNRYIDPPMPYMGKTMNFAKLMDRSFYARKVSAEILKVINKDALISLEESKSIPVTNDMYRVVITKEIMDNMAKRHKQKHINQMIKGNLSTIQRALEYRKMTLNLMNMNYSNALVRNLDLTSLEESRAYTEYRVVDRPDVPLSEFATRRGAKMEEEGGPDGKEG